MKPKKYSKQTVSKPSLSSMLIQKPSSHRQVYISLRLDPHLTNLDVSNNNITSLDGIKNYQELQCLNLSHNNIRTVQDLEPLAYCLKMKLLKVQGNPLCNQMNYILHIASLLPTLEVIDGVDVSEGFEGLRNMQIDLGNRIMGFLLQKCRIGAEIIQIKQSGHVPEGRDWRPLTEQLVQIVEVLVQSKQNVCVLDINWDLKANLPLSSISCVHPTQQNQEQVQNYLIERIITESSTTMTKLAVKLVNKIEVSDDNEETLILQNPQFAREIIKNELIQEYRSFLQPLNKGEQLMKHFTSADTAMDSNDRYHLQQKAKSFIHFLLDYDYMQVLLSVLIQQCEFINKNIYEVMGNSKRLHHPGVGQSIAHNNDNDNKIQEESQEQGTSIFGDQSNRQIHQPLTFKSKQIYGNPIILENIVTFCEKAVLRIFFKRIKKCKSKNLLSKICHKLAFTMQRITLRQKQSFWRVMQARDSFLVQMRQFLQRKKLQRLFVAWKNIKKRQTRLLKKILKKKQKGDDFMKALCILRWRMNTRDISLHRKTSQIIFKTATVIQQLPTSKKTIDLAYNQVKTKRKNMSRPSLRVKM